MNKNEVMLSLLEAGVSKEVIAAVNKCMPNEFNVTGKMYDKEEAKKLESSLIAKFEQIVDKSMQSGAESIETTPLIVEMLSKMTPDELDYYVAARISNDLELVAMNKIRKKLKDILR